MQEAPGDLWKEIPGICRPNPSSWGMSNVFKLMFKDYNRKQITDKNVYKTYTNLYETY